MKEFFSKNFLVVFLAWGMSFSFWFGLVVSGIIPASDATVLVNVLSCVVALPLLLFSAAVVSVLVKGK